MEYIDFIFDGMPGPVGPRFIDVVDPEGKSFKVGEWRTSLRGTAILRVKLSLGMGELLKQQAILQERMGWPNGIGVPGFKENMTHLLVEMVEALQEMSFKPWKPETYPPNAERLATEMADALMFWANAAICMGLMPDDLSRAIRNKWVVIHQRIDSGEVKSK